MSIAIRADNGLIRLYTTERFAIGTVLFCNVSPRVRSRWRVMGNEGSATLLAPDATPARLPLLWRPRPFKAARRRCWGGSEA